MTSSSAHRSGIAPRETSNGSVEPMGPPSDAVTLNDLIADSGPLPADAALECVQRLATLLNGYPDIDCGSLGPSDVLIDDDGEVWLTRKLRSASHVDTIAEPQTMRLDRLGRLLAFLATGEHEHLSSSFIHEPTSSPSPIATVAADHFAKNGVCYQSYAELAREAAGLTEPASLKLIPPASSDISGEATDELPEPVTPDAPVAFDSPENALDDEHQVTEPSGVVSEVAEEPASETGATVGPSHDEPPHSAAVEPSVSTLNDDSLNEKQAAEPVEMTGNEKAVAVTTTQTEGSWLGIGVAVATAAGATIAYVIWQYL